MTAASRGSMQHLIVVSLLATVVTIGVVAIRTIGSITKDSASGAERSSIYHEALSAGYPLESQIDWLPNAPDLSRSPTDATLARFERDWAAVWFVIDGMSSNRSVADPRVLIGDSVVRRIEQHQPAVRRQSVTQQHHTLRVNYYSVDGAVIGINVVTASALHSFADSVNGYPLELEQVSSFDAVLVLTDGRWRLVSLQRLPLRSPSTFAQDVPISQADTSTTGSSP